MGSVMAVQKDWTLVYKMFIFSIYSSVNLNIASCYPLAPVNRPEDAVMHNKSLRICIYISICKQLDIKTLLDKLDVLELEL